MIDWGTTGLFVALSMIAALFAWRTETRAIGLVLTGQVMVCTIAVLIFGVEAEPAANAFGEIAIITAAGPVLLFRPILATTILTLSTISCCRTIVHLTAPLDAQNSYEVTVNVILFLQCVIVLNTDFWHVVGNSIARRGRWRGYRRRTAAICRGELVDASTESRPF